MRDDEPWFVAADVCAALEIANSRDALMKLDADEKGVGLTDTLGGRQQVAIVSESGMYALVLRCRDAINPGTVPHRFRKWVTSIVRPAIRKTGQFTAQPCIDAAPDTAHTPADLASLYPADVERALQLLNKHIYQADRYTACSSSCRTTKPKSPSSSPPAAIGTSAPAR